MKVSWSRYKVNSDNQVTEMTIATAKDVSAKARAQRAVYYGR